MTGLHIHHDSVLGAVHGPTRTFQRRVPRQYNPSSFPLLGVKSSPQKARCTCSPTESHPLGRYLGTSELLMASQGDSPSKSNADHYAKYRPESGPNSEDGRGRASSLAGFRGGEATSDAKYRDQ